MNRDQDSIESKLRALTSIFQLLESCYRLTWSTSLLIEHEPELEAELLRLREHLSRKERTLVDIMEEFRDRTRAMDLDWEGPEQAGVASGQLRLIDCRAPTATNILRTQVDELLEQGRLEIGKLSAADERACAESWNAMSAIPIATEHDLAALAVARLLDGVELLLNANRMLWTSMHSAFFRACVASCNLRNRTAHVDQVLPSQIRLLNRNRFRAIWSEQTHMFRVWVLSPPDGVMPRKSSPDPVAPDLYSGTCAGEPLIFQAQFRHQTTSVLSKLAMVQRSYNASGNVSDKGLTRLEDWVIAFCCSRLQKQTADIAGELSRQASAHGDVQPEDVARVSWRDMREALERSVTEQQSFGSDGTGQNQCV